MLLGRLFHFFSFISKINDIIRGLASALYSCPNHLSAFAIAAISIDEVKPSTVTSSWMFFLSVSFIPHIALNLALSVFLKIATSLLFNIQAQCFSTILAWVNVHSSNKLFRLQS